MEVSLSSEALTQLNTAEAKALHDISDSLSSCGVGRIVNLPQIIVVGEQSSGKSSVLEAISHVRFPVDGGLCTRFATELVLRPADETRVDVSVKFADKSKAPQAFHRQGFREEDLPEIIDEAKGHMGFTGAAGKRFSKDVLRLEIQGPKMYPLSLVDLPGLFHNLTETQSLSDMAVVNELVQSYMQQKNSIVLVVITANNQLASHTALKKVKEVDPHGLRTIGVITKPDLTRPGFSDEKMYVRVAKNQEAANKLHLGWHVLRNRAEDETSLEGRDKLEEAFFKSGAWASVPRDDRGIESLRRKLSRVLYSHIRNGLPEVIADIEVNLRERQEELERLGRPRATHEDMRSFLLEIAADFQRLARDGIEGRYNDSFFGGLDDETLKLRAQVRNFNRAFDHVLKAKGSAQVVVASLFTNPAPKEVPKHLEAFLKKHAYDFPDPVPVTKRSFDAQLLRQAAANQGREFPGSPNKDLAIQLFKRQADPWKKIAKFHIERVSLVAKAFVDEVFKHVVGAPTMTSTTEAILSTCVDPFFDEKERLLESKLEELLRPYSQGFALPLDADFHHLYTEKVMTNVAGRVESILQKKHPGIFESGSQTKPSTEMIKQAIASEKESGDDEFGMEMVVDMMEIYYEMSRRTFTDNVINLAIESCLVCHIPDILTPTVVDAMTKEKLQDLAAESGHTTARRQVLQEEVEVLRQGLAQCRRYRPRPLTVLPGSPKGPIDMKRVVTPKTKKSPQPASTKASSPGTSLFNTTTPQAGSNLFSALPSPSPSASPFGNITQAQGDSKPAFNASLPLFGESSTSKPSSTQPTATRPSTGAFGQHLSSSSPWSTPSGSGFGGFGNRQGTQKHDKASPIPEVDFFTLKTMYPYYDNRASTFAASQQIDRFQNICFLGSSENYSPEELRLEHLRSMRRL